MPKGHNSRPAHQVNRTIKAHKEIKPAIEIKEAADIQSAAVAIPFANGETPPRYIKLLSSQRDQIAILYRKQK